MSASSQRGLVPASLVDKENKSGYKPYATSDTFFSVGHFMLIQNASDY